jgi:hypothetical protein
MPLTMRLIRSSQLPSPIGYRPVMFEPVTSCWRSVVQMHVHVALRTHGIVSMITHVLPLMVVT